MENGMTPVRTGEYPVIDADVTPDECTPVEDAGMVDESEIPADQRDNGYDAVPDSSATPDPRPLGHFGYDGCFDTPDPNANADPNASPTPTPDRTHADATGPQ
jgi:hypothetical protein